MLNGLVVPIFALLGTFTEKEVLPTFLPFNPAPQPEIAEVCEHLQEQPEFSSLISTYEKSLKTPNPSSLNQNENKLFTHPLSRFISSKEDALKAKVFKAVKEGTYSVLRELFPWEMYDFFVPKIERIFSGLRFGINWFQKHNRDRLNEGKFLRKLEREDYYSAGAMAHHIAQYFWHSLVIERDLYAFVLDNTTFHSYKKPILEHMKYLRHMYTKWNNRRLKLYHMNHALLEARQAQLILKLKCNEANDTAETAEIMVRINRYENLINALQAAFFNDCMDEKGLSVLERVWDTTSSFIEKVGAFLRLNEKSQTPLNVTTYLDTLKRMVEEDKKVVLKQQSIDPQDWDLYDWQLKPPNEFQRRFEEKNPEDKPTPKSFLFNLLVWDNIHIARHLCNSVIIKPQDKNNVWDEQRQEIEVYSVLLKKLFEKQQETDNILKLLGEEAEQFEKESKESALKNPTQLYANMSDCERLSLLLFNKMVHVKWAFLKKTKDNFNKEDTTWQRIVNSIKRKGIRLATEGTLWDKTPNFKDSQEEAEKLLVFAEATLQAAKGLMGLAAQNDTYEGFEVLPQGKLEEDLPFQNSPPISSPHYWNQVMLNMNTRASQTWGSLKEWGEWGKDNLSEVSNTWKGKLPLSSRSSDDLEKKKSQ